MDTVIQTQGFKLTYALEQFTRSQVKKSLRYCADQIIRVTVRFKDINGPKGGEDKHCSMKIKFSSKPTVVISKTTADMYQSIYQTAKKAARTALRHLRRYRALSKKSIQPKLTEDMRMIIETDYLSTEQRRELSIGPSIRTDTDHVDDIQQHRYRTALGSPSQVYRKPTDVVADKTMSRREKQNILHSWLTDAFLLQAAEYEGLEGGESCSADDIKACLEQLEN